MKQGSQVLLEFVTNYRFSFRAIIFTFIGWVRERCLVVFFFFFFGGGRDVFEPVFFPGNFFGNDFPLPPSQGNHGSQPLTLIVKTQ